MRSFTIIALVAAVPAFVSAADLTVKVGANNQLTFTPPSLNASVGDTVTFIFQSKNHSVFASIFADPCTHSNAFNSPFFPITNSTSPSPRFVLNITDTKPVWYHCGQTNPINHCKAGMVGAINPTADKSFAEFQSNAIGNSTSTGGSSVGSATAGFSPSATGISSPSAAASSSPAATASSSPSAPTNSNGAMRISDSAAALLTLVGVVAGITTF